MVSFQRQETAFAVPLTELPRLRSQNNQSQNNQSQNNQSQNNPRWIPLKTPVVEVDGQSQLADVEHPAMLLAQRLRGSGEEGRGFGWLPNDDTQLQQLSDFLLDLHTAKGYLKNNKPDYRDPADVQAAREMLRNAVDQTQQSLRNELQEAFNRADSRLKTLNKLAQQRMQGRGEAIVPILVEVTAGASQLDFLVLQIESVQDYVTIPYDPTAPVMRPGSRWLILVRSPADKPVKSFRTAADRRISAREVERITEIGPLQ
jgi:hypothetical protein